MIYYILKAICEFVTCQQFEERNPYEHIINVFSPKLTDCGVNLFGRYHIFTTKYLMIGCPKMLDKASAACQSRDYKP